MMKRALWALASVALCDEASTGPPEGPTPTKLMQARLLSAWANLMPEDPLTPLASEPSAARARLERLARAV